MCGTFFLELTTLLGKSVCWQCNELPLIFEVHGLRLYRESKSYEALHFLSDLRTLKSLFFKTIRKKLYHRGLTRSSIQLWFTRSNHSQIFFKIDVLKNFTIFTWKHLYWSLFFIKLQVLRPATLLERDSNTGVFL